ncbi:SDR family oxidoreductase [Neolewinella litorea]|uniref:SDR family oxidoreductase n=1 Tax=Neolewinella litorea TaxID=2562452 RepID=A0A4S4NRM1_9BACT|nr:SDR family oxidoreductase [Neolewinella litorea]THH41018.1 SDR family oxidoreductase [Neolewinella litorea]
MDLGLTGKTIAVGGATSGLGKAIAERLILEGATVLGIARSHQTLEEMQTVHGKAFIPVMADLSDSRAVETAAITMNDHQITGCVLNSGGPPPGRVQELSLDDWDAAYHSTLRWKLQLTHALLPSMRERGGGKFIYLESVSIKQPIDNLVLSNVFRAGVAGFVKTLSREEGPNGITANIVAPGYHDTDRISTVLDKAAQLQNIDRGTIEKEFLAEVPLGALGQPKDFAGMVAFLLSPFARYITGQTITIDGGMVRYITG